MKRFLTSAICVMLAVISLVTCTVPASAASVAQDAAMTGSTMYGGVDYSGKGTVIKGTVAVNNAATVSGDYVNIPVYKGKYVAGAGNSWRTKKWSGWSTENNKENPDFTVYNGTNKAKQYDVESREEYQYKWTGTEDVYTKMYCTVYQGKKWSNFWDKFTVTDPNGYGKARSGYKIVKKYTKSVVTGEKTVTHYDDTWYAEKPVFMKLLDGKVEVYNTRTTYRYRSRTLKWNSKASVTTEQVPLNYALKDRQGQSIGYGIHLKSVADFSPHYKSGLFGTRWDDLNYSFDYYYLNVDAMQSNLLMAILKSQGTDEVTMLLKTLIQGGTMSVSKLLSLVALRYPKNQVLKALGDTGVMTNFVFLPATIANIALQVGKGFSYNELVETLEQMEEYEYVVICFSEYSDRYSASAAPPLYEMDIRLVDRKDTQLDNISSISMRFTDNKEVNGTLTDDYETIYDLEYFGEISYVYDMDLLEKQVKTYFESYDIFDFTSWFDF